MLTSPVKIPLQPRPSLPYPSLSLRPPVTPFPSQISQPNPATLFLSQIYKSPARNPFPLIDQQNLLIACSFQILPRPIRPAHRAFNSKLSTLNPLTPLTPIFPLHTKIPLVTPLLPLHTQKQGGRGPQSPKTSSFTLTIALAPSNSSHFHGLRKTTHGCRLPFPHSNVTRQNSPQAVRCKLSAVSSPNPHPAKLCASFRGALHV